MLKVFKRKSAFLSALRVCLSVAGFIGFAARFTTAVLVSLAAQLMVSIKKYILSGIMLATVAIAKGSGFIRQGLTRTITTVEKNNSKWLKVEVKGYTLLVGRRNK